MKRFYLIALLLAGLAGCSAASEESGFSGAVKAITSGGAASSGSSGSSTTVAAPARPPANTTAPAPAAQTTYDANGMATGSTVPAAGLVHAAAIDPNDLVNIPSVQEVHYMTSRRKCEQLYQKLLQQGANFTKAEFFNSNMPGDPEGGHCKLTGPSAIDNRFVDRRYDNDP
jgi:hypothetical protein